jgi:hypothetical protein
LVSPKDTGKTERRQGERAHMRGVWDVFGFEQFQSILYMRGLMKYSQHQLIPRREKEDENNYSTSNNNQKRNHRCSNTPLSNLDKGN